MTRVIISGGAGYIGRFLTEAALGEEMDVKITGLHKPADDNFSSPVEFVKAPLDPSFNYDPIFSGADYFIHAAFDRAQGDPNNFALANLGGTAAMFKAAKRAGIRRAVFLSSEAVYGSDLAGSDLYETDEANPDTLFGKIKAETEKLILQMATPDFLPISLRLSQIYGSAARNNSHAWIELFDSFARGENITSDAGGYVHGEDVARAVLITLGAQADRLAGSIFNVSDIVIDRQDILAALKSRLSLDYDLPERVSRDDISALNCDRIKNLGWRAAGPLKLEFTLERLIDDWVRQRAN